MSYPWYAIAAMSQNRVIGQNGQLPWHIPEDLKWVKQCTLGKTIAMGRKTFDSMGRPWPKRTNIVFSKSVSHIDGCVVLPSVEDLLHYQTPQEIWIFGGAEIYRQALPHVRDLFLTVVHRDYQGDAFFPPFEDSFTLRETLREDAIFSILHYRNRSFDA